MVALVAAVAVCYHQTALDDAIHLVCRRQANRLSYRLWGLASNVVAMEQAAREVELVRGEA